MSKNQMLTHEVGNDDVVIHKGAAWVVEQTEFDGDKIRKSHKIRCIGAQHSKLVFSNTVRKVMSGKEDLPSVNELKQMSYDAMFVEDFMRDGEIAEILNGAGLANGTVCPECRVDDFTHGEGCSKQRLLEDRALYS